nr:hypothetical protein Q903MT_gene2318 [Picea sitchensis]
MEERVEHNNQYCCPGPVLTYWYGSLGCPAVFIILVVSGSSSIQFLNMSNYVSSSNRVTSFPIDMVKAE